MRASLIVGVSIFTCVLSLLLATTPSAKRKPKPKPVACSGRYVVNQGAEAIVADSTPDIAVVSVEGKKVSLGAHCGPASGSVKALKSATNVAAGYKSCGATLRQVKLKAKITGDCNSMTGVVRAKKLKPQHFQASRSRCGDGVFDRGGSEACEGAVGCNAGATCTADCTCTTGSTLPQIGICTTSGTACGQRSECPIQPTAEHPMQGEGCCGDKVPDGPAFGETCDLGKDGNCPTSVACAQGCTSQCRSVGTCTGGSTLCVLNADCGGQSTCCGNHVIDPGETCDDGNMVDGGPTDLSPFVMDGCPGSCHVDACTPTATTLSTTVTFTFGGSGTIAGLIVFVDYPEGRVTAPTFSNAFNVSGTPTDSGYGFVAVPIKTSGLPPSFMHATFKTCQGAPTVTAGDFKCSVKDVSDDLGNVVPADQVTCAVTIP